MHRDTINFCSSCVMKMLEPSSSRAEVLLLLRYEDWPGNELEKEEENVLLIINGSTSLGTDFGGALN